MLIDLCLADDKGFYPRKQNYELRITLEYFPLDILNNYVRFANESFRQLSVRQSPGRFANVLKSHHRSGRQRLQ